MEQDLHNRDEVIRGDHGEMIWERDIYQQNQIVAKARQQMLLQRDMLYVLIYLYYHISVNFTFC